MMQTIVNHCAAIVICKSSSLSLISNVLPMNSQ